MSKQDTKIINESKALALDMINNAGSGHPGISIDLAEVLYTLYGKILHVNSSEEKWINRDRLVLSSGHGSAILYSTLHLCGFDITINDLKDFRRINSVTPGHPEVGVTPGVDASTGYLGMGIGNAVGMAFAERYVRSLIQKEKPKSKLINYHTFCICGDGDLMEGSSYEALSFAGFQKLNKLILIYNKNKVTCDGEVDCSFNEDIIDRFESMHFNVLTAKSNKTESLLEVINLAKKSKKPSLIIINNTIGKGLLKEGTCDVHSGVISEKDLNNFKNNINHTLKPFTVDEVNAIEFKSDFDERSSKVYKSWLKEYDEVINEKNQKIIDILKYLKNSDFKLDLENIDFKIGDDFSEELRRSNQKLLNIVSVKNKFFLGGSADLQKSCKTYINKSGYNTYVTPFEKNISFGVREAAMGNILNGIALSGISCFGSTMLSFSDQIKPSIRLASMMKLPVTYIFTHDSISIGYDGPTHQPIEQLATLRMIPDLFTFRPADIHEVIGAWDFIIKNKTTTCLSISKEKLPKIATTNPKYVKYGAYMVRKEMNKIDGIIISSGEDLHLALNVAEELAKEGFELRVVSMPCMELFLKQHPKYENQLLPKDVKTFVIEASASIIWNRFATTNNYIFGVDSFGKSGSPLDVKSEYGFNTLKIKNKIKQHIATEEELEFL